MKEIKRVPFFMKHNVLCPEHCDACFFVK